MDSPSIPCNLRELEPVIRDHRAGRIVVQSGQLYRIVPRYWGYKASVLRAKWDSWRRGRSSDRCDLFYHQSPSNRDFLVIGYVQSPRSASLASFYCSVLVLDEIARIKGSAAIVAQVTNPRISDRLMSRWGWQAHCPQWKGRHFIKRFYGTYPPIPDAWHRRIGLTKGLESASF